jgi:SAM-dependent methyltransferase
MADPDRPSERPEPDQQGGAIWWHSHVRYLFARELAAGRRVLDLACGNGFGTVVLAEVAKDVVGGDVSAEAVATAQRLNPRPNVRYQHVTRPPFPFADAAFDLIVCLETIEHMHAPEQAPFVAELSRVLAPDGVLVLSTPDRDTERAHALMTEEPNPYHLHTPSAAELDQLLAAFPHRVDLVQQEFVATTLVPVDRAARDAKLASPLLAFGDGERPSPVAVVRACARTPEGLERIRAARAPVAYRGDFQRLAFIAQVLSNSYLPNLEGLPIEEQVAYIAHHYRRHRENAERRIKDLENTNVFVIKSIDTLNKNLSIRGVIDRIRGKRSD